MIGDLCHLTQDAEVLLSPNRRYFGDILNGTLPWKAGGVRSGIEDATLLAIWKKTGFDIF